MSFLNNSVLFLSFFLLENFSGALPPPPSRKPEELKIRPFLTHVEVFLMQRIQSDRMETELLSLE